MSSRLRASSRCRASCIARLSSTPLVRASMASSNARCSPYRPTENRRRLVRPSASRQFAIKRSYSRPSTMYRSKTTPTHTRLALHSARNAATYSRVGLDSAQEPVPETPCREIRLLAAAPHGIREMARIEFALSSYMDVPRSAIVPVNVRARADPCGALHSGLLLSTVTLFREASPDVLGGTLGRKLYGSRPAANEKITFRARFHSLGADDLARAHGP